MSRIVTPFTDAVGIDVPLICGAMYPCSNPELIAAVSAAGGIGVIQPISMFYVHRHDLREGIRLIRSLTDKPIGFNAIVEQSSKVYEDRMRAWVDVALEEGVRFFVTALGNPRWVVDKVHAVGGVVYHDVTERRWALKALEHDVDGLICVNARAGGHAGSKTPEALFAELADLGVPLICAGGVGSPERFAEALKIGYAGVQMGTRFIATEECNAHLDYKQAIVRARAEDIVLTDKISGVPVAVIKTPYIEKIGTKAGPIARRMLRHPRLKHYMRMFYSLKSVWQLRRASLQGAGYRDYFQAGKSVDGIAAIEPAGAIVERFAAAVAG
ncbi:MAG: nitronate monooxygenase [Myxococcales bacterium]|nr:nitronate monooxygenase [Myxococcales bacterium]MCB9705989.1 nitronate monooxygenase [Myxococcales bacterium]